MDKKKNSIFADMAELTSGNSSTEPTVKTPMIAGGKDCKSVADLREHFLSNVGEVLDQYLNVATGRDIVRSTNHSMRAEVWELAKELLKNSGERILVDTNGTPDGIMLAVQQGQCSIQDAEKLLKLYATVKEIEQIGKDVGGGGNFPFIQFNVRTPEGGIIEGKVVQPDIIEPIKEEIREITDIDVPLTGDGVAGD